MYKQRQVLSYFNLPTPIPPPSLLISPHTGILANTVMYLSREWCLSMLLETKMSWICHRTSSRRLPRMTCKEVSVGKGEKGNKKQDIGLEKQRVCMLKSKGSPRGKR